MKNDLIIKKIDILLPIANIQQQHKLIDLKEELKHTDVVTSSTLRMYEEIEHNVISHLPIADRRRARVKLQRIDNMLFDDSILDYDVNRRIDMIQKELERFIARPRIFEKEAQQKLAEIDEKFRELMKIKDKNSSITEQVYKVNQLEEKLDKMQTEAQLLLNGISTVQLGKQYLEAKNRYCYFVPPKKFSRSKKRFMRLLLNIWFYILWIFKRMFQLNFFLYCGFIISLLLLTLSYGVLIISQSTSYKDLAMTIPMLWSAWFFQRKINTREKLFEVYNHKQKVMETYVAFKNSVYTFGAEDKMEEVLLEAIKKDPSDCIGKDNTTIVETILDRLRGLFVSEKIKKAIKDDMND